jgi:hypothetical protein
VRRPLRPLLLNLLNLLPPLLLKVPPMTVV